MDSQRKSVSRVWVLPWTMSVVLLYPLSIGPFIWTAEHLLPQPVTAAIWPFYDPLVDVCGHSELASRLLWGYAALWGPTIDM